MTINLDWSGWRYWAFAIVFNFPERMFAIEFGPAAVVFEFRR